MTLDQMIAAAQQDGITAITVWPCSDGWQCNVRWASGGWTCIKAADPVLGLRRALGEKPALAKEDIFG